MFRIQTKGKRAMENNTQKSNQDNADELRMAAIMRKRTDQLTPDDRAFLAAGIAQWKAENDAR
jgi:hypothetical protein